MSETGELLRRGVAELLEAVVSLRFRARRLVNDHPGDWDLTRAVDALDERASALVAMATPDYRWHHPLTFNVKPIGRDHLVVVTSRVPDGKKVVVVDDATGGATLGLVAPGYPEIVVALGQWADRVERVYTE